jgi:large subunit ribosomal protein L9
MEVILLEDMEGVGDKGALVNVKPGFARNYLLPRKLAIEAGTKSANLFKELSRQRDVRDQKLVEAARAEAAKLEGVEVNISAQANEEDTLFGSVTESDIADAIEKAGHAVTKQQIVLEEHIKQLGKFDVRVRVYKDIFATVKVWVLRP